MEPGSSDAAALAIPLGLPLEDLDPSGGDFVHLVVEASKLAFARPRGLYATSASLERCRWSACCLPHTMIGAGLIGDQARSGRLIPGSTRTVPPETASGGDCAKRKQSAALGAGEPVVGGRATVTVRRRRRGDYRAYDVRPPAHNGARNTRRRRFGLQKIQHCHPPSRGFPLGTRAARMFWLERGLQVRLRRGKRRVPPGCRPFDGLRRRNRTMPGARPQGRTPGSIEPGNLLAPCVFALGLQQADEADPAWHSDHFPALLLVRVQRGRARHWWSRGGCRADGRRSKAKRGVQKGTRELGAKGRRKRRDRRNGAR